MLLLLLRLDRLNGGGGDAPSGGGRPTTAERREGRSYVQLACMADRMALSGVVGRAG